MSVGSVDRSRFRTAATWRGRPAISAAATVALATACLVAGCSGSGAAQSSESSSPEPVPTVVSCPGGNVNSGSADSAGETKGVPDVREHASQWANVTGFADRFPGARLTVGQGQDTAFARFVDQNQLRAQLTYRKVADSWALDTLEYC